ncbi:MAG: hypothetical protein CVT80_01130 [Alphaproteobacteria bacterium HGW-Alphaproteobacteria-2]|nr:MAG: hypothetical protein CVT80_01130 [Alphaproteobacteria bacterium HGW-Alphaproteobacteria-2]
MLNRRTVLKYSAAAAATLAAPGIARAAPVKIIMAHATAEVHPAHIATVEFKNALERLAPGATEIQLFPNRQLGDDKQLLEATIAGTVQISLASGVLFPLVTGRPALDAFQLPFLVRDYDHMEELTTSEVGQKILDDLEPAGIIGLTNVDIGQRHFLSVGKPVLSLPDFSGLKTRIVPVPLHRAIWEAVGAAPVGLPYGEVYGALQTGVIDAVEINVSSMLGENLWEVGKHFTLTGHYPWHSVISANKTFFDGLPAELQAAVRQAGRDAVAPTMAYTKKQDHDGRAELQAKGVEIHELANLADMRARVAPLIDSWSEKSPLIAEFAAQALATA